MIVPVSKLARQSYNSANGVRTLHYAQTILKGIPNMILKKTAMAAEFGGRIREATPTCSIRVNGQIGFNKVVPLLTNGKSGNGAEQSVYAVMVDFTGEKGSGKGNLMFIPRNVADKTKIPEDYYKLGFSAVTGGTFFAASAILKWIGYDYKKLNNQNLSVVLVDHPIEGKNKDGKTVKQTVKALQVVIDTSKLKPTTPKVKASKGASKAASKTEDTPLEDID